MKTVKGNLKRIGDVKAPCPDCEVGEVSTERVSSEPIDGGLRFVNVPCSSCAKLFTVEITDSAPPAAPKTSPPREVILTLAEAQARATDMAGILEEVRYGLKALTLNAGLRSEMEASLAALDRKILTVKDAAQRTLAYLAVAPIVELPDA